MAARLVRTALVTAALAGTLGLTACGSNQEPAAEASAATQLARNEQVHDLAAAQRATLVPAATQLEQLGLERQRAVLAGAAVADVEQRIAAQRALVESIEAAPSAEAVRALVDEAGLVVAPAVVEAAAPAAVPGD